MTRTDADLDLLVLGCGYVGRALASRAAESGWTVGGVVKSPGSAAEVDGLAATVEGIRADLTDPEAVASLPDAERLVFAASAGRGNLDLARALYGDGLDAVLAEYADRTEEGSRPHLVFTSTTGVYGDHGGDWVDESTPPSPESPKAALIADAETRVREGPIPGTVARFGGLYGPGRFRVERYLDGPVTEGWLNATHRADAAGGLAHLLDLGPDAVGGRVVNVVGAPAWKPDFAAWVAEQCGRPAPAVQTVEERLAADDYGADAARRIRSQKRVANDRLLDLDYELAYPTLEDGYRDAVEAYLADDA